MIKQIRERVARTICEADNKNWDSLKDDYENFGDDGYVKSRYLRIADQILSIRLNDKGEPDPEGDWELVTANKKTGQIVSFARIVEE